MRVMFTVFPAPAHFWPVVPYAWALQSAGHEVCVATPPGVDSGVATSDFHREVNRAGLSAVRCGQPAPLSLMDTDHSEYASLAPTVAEADRLIEALGIEPKDYDAWDVFYHFMLTTIHNYHPPQVRPDIAELVDFACAWRPDLVLWEPWFPCGAVAAQASGAAHARILESADYSGWFVGMLNAGSPRVESDNPLAAALQPLAEHYGLDVTEELLLGQWTINPFPPGMGLPTSTPTIRTRYVPYSSAAVMPDWLHRPTDRPRVALSLGVSTREYRRGDWGRAGKLLHALSDLDVEVVATLNANQLADLAGQIPDNVRVIDYLPLRQLLPTCAAVIHHGGPASTAAASAMNVPQLVCDTEERSRNYGVRAAEGLRIELLCERQITASAAARYVTSTGAGARLDHQTQSVAQLRDTIQQVIEDPRVRAGADRVREEWNAPPSPAAIVPLLERKTAEHRR
jgi:UDP:flavonoid glycosyltransferase YjiC (YdhE family)